MKKIIFWLFIVLVCGSIVPASAQRKVNSKPKSATTASPTASQPAKTRPTQTKTTTSNTASKAQVGLATFYPKNTTARMANGKRHHRDSMFCAHRTHPFGTLLKVTNLRNNKIVVVKVTDRGPFGRNRVIDLSYGAAQKLGFVAAGVTKVKIELFDGRLESEYSGGETDSTDLLLDYNNPEGFDLPYRPGKDGKKK